MAPQSAASAPIGGILVMSCEHPVYKPNSSRKSICGKYNSTGVYRATAGQSLAYSRVEGFLSENSTMVIGIVFT